MFEPQSGVTIPLIGGAGGVVVVVIIIVVVVVVVVIKRSKFLALLQDRCGTIHLTDYLYVHV